MDGRDGGRDGWSWMVVMVVMGVLDGRDGWS